MSPLLQIGLEQLERDLGLSPETIERVDVDKKGGVVFTCELDGTPRWFQLARDRLVELRPDADERLPICRRLADLAQDGDPRILAWRPGRRITIQSPGTNGDVVVKGYRLGQSRRAARALERAGEPTSTGGFLVPRFIQWEQESDAVTMELLDGAPLSIGTSDAESFYRVGYGLRSFQEAVPCHGLEQFGIAKELAVLDAWHAKTNRAGVPASELWRGTFDALAVAADRVEAAEPVAVHRDLHDGQLLEVGRRIGLIDFDSLRAGDPIMDAANLTSHLTLRALQRIRGATDAGAEACSSAFLDGFDRSDDSRTLTALRFYQGSTFLRLALVYSLRPRWRRLAPVLEGLAAQCLSEIHEA